MNKKVMTIVIPAYNLENYIEKTLRSIANQTYKNIEIIIINDGSKDKTSEVARKFLEKTNLDYKIIDKKNEGVSVARNIGLENANGEYIFFLDGDDLIKADAIEKIIKKFEEEKVDFVYCGINKAEEDGTIIGSYEKSYSYLSESITALDFIKKLLRQEVWVIPVNAFFRKDIIDKYNLRFTKGCTNGEDQEFYFKYLCHCSKVDSVNECLSDYVQRKSSISNSANFSKFTAIDAFDRVNKYILDNFKDNDLIELLNNKYKREFFTNFNSIIKFCSVEEEQKIKEILKQYKYITDKGKYKPVNSSKSEAIFSKRYALLINHPRFYVRLFRWIYKRKGTWG